MMKKEKKKAPPKKHAPKSQKKASEGGESADFRGIIRIAGKDMPGHIPLKRALLKVRGISHTVAGVAVTVLEKELSLEPMLKIGELNDSQIEKIDNILTNLHEHGVPPFLLNRRIDYKTGQDKHIIMSDLLFETGQDIEREKKLYTWRGYRHFYGQKVRGQRTRNTGRRGMAVGVLRKAVIAAQGGKTAAAPAAAGGKAEAKK